MINPELAQTLEEAGNEILQWVGFGTLVGLVAKAIMPGRDPGGTLATLLMGITGTVIGCGAVRFFFEGNRVTPLSLNGFVASTGGAFVLLLFYRLFLWSQIRAIDAGVELPIRHRRARDRRRTRRVA